MTRLSSNIITTELCWRQSAQVGETGLLELLLVGYLATLF
jgi:hypothetical protein